MTQDEIIEMARDTANHGTHASGEVIYTFYSEQLEAFAKLVAAKAIAGLESQEQNFCPRCGKRTNDIHTCTPPQRTWVGLTNNELQPIADEYRILFGGWVEDFARAIESKLKEKNT
jgi:hypothetical protein